MTLLFLKLSEAASIIDKKKINFFIKLKHPKKNYESPSKQVV